MKEEVPLLTPRQWRILELLAQGLTNKDIAFRLHLSALTVGHYLCLDDDDPRAIFQRIGVTNRTEAAVWFKEYWLNSPDVDYARANLQRISDTRIQGNPQLGITMAMAENEWLKQKARRLSTPKLSLEYERIRGGVLFQEAMAYQESVFKQELWASARWLPDELLAVAKTCGDAELFGLGRLTQTDVFYILGQFDDAIRWATEALKYITTADYQLWTLRTQCLAYAYNRGSERVKQIGQRMNGLIESGLASEVFICHAYEGLGRALGINKSEESFEYLEKGWQLNAKIQAGEMAVPVLTVALAKSTAEVMQYLEPTNKPLWESRIQAGLILARVLRHQYHRHVALIPQLLAKCLA